MENNLIPMILRTGTGQIETAGKKYTCLALIRKVYNRKKAACVYIACHN
jgi:hypothetical protein